MDAPTVIDDATAQQYVDNYAAAPEAEQATMKAQLRAYQDNRELKGLTDSVKASYSDFDTMGGTWTNDGQQWDNNTKAEVANRRFMALQQGSSVQTMGDTYQGIRSKYSLEKYGNADLSEYEFYGKVQKDLKNAEDQKAAISELPAMAVNSIVEGKTSTPQEIQQWKEKNGALFPNMGDAQALSGYQAMKDKLTADYGDIAPRVKPAIDALKPWVTNQKESGNDYSSGNFLQNTPSQGFQSPIPQARPLEKTGEDVDKLVDNLTKFSDDQRQRMYGLMGAYIQSKGQDPQTVFGNIAKSFGRTAGDIATSVMTLPQELAATRNFNIASAPNGYMKQEDGSLVDPTNSDDIQQQGLQIDGHPVANGSKTAIRSLQQAKDTIDGSQFETKLTTADEVKFQAWKAKYAPHDSGADYDLRGAFKDGLKPDPETGHWPDTFKKPNEPTFSDLSKYATGEYSGLAGHWDGDNFVLPKSFEGPKMREGAHWATPKEKAADVARLQKQLKAIQIQRELRGIAQGQIDPIKNLHGGLAGIGESMAYGVAGTAPYLIGAAVPVVGEGLVMGAMTATESDRIRSMHPHIAPETALGMATVSGAAQGLLINMTLGSTFGKLPITAKFFKSLENPASSVWGTLGRAGISAGELSAQGIAQTATPFLVDGLAKSFGADMPDFKWKEAFKDFKGALPQTFATLAPLWIFGAGKISLDAWKNGRRVAGNAEIIKMLGIPEATAKDIAGEKDLKKQADKFQKALNELTPEQKVEIVKKTNEAMKQAEAIQANPESVTVSQNGGEFEVSHQGEFVLDYPDPQAAAIAAEQHQTHVEKDAPKRPNIDVKTSGIAQRFYDEAGIPIKPGKGVTPEEITKRGQALYKAGADVEAILAKIDNGEGLNGDETAIIKARSEDLLKMADDAKNEAEANPDNFQAQKNADLAHNNYVAFQERIKPSATVWHGAGMARQGETDLDTGNWRAFERAAEDSAKSAGRELTPEERGAAKKESTAVAESNAKIKELQAKLDAMLAEKVAPRGTDSPLPKIRKPVRDFLSKAADDARARVAERRKNGVRYSANPADPETVKAFADEIIIGADHLAKGISDFADWSSKMVKELGEAIAPHLKAIFNAAKEKLDEVSKSAESEEFTKKSKEEIQIERTRKSLDALDKKLQTGEVEAAKHPYEPVSDELQNIRNERDAVKAELLRQRNALTEKLSPDEKAIKDTQDQIAELDRRLQEGDVAAKKNPEKEVSPELERLRAERDALNNELQRQRRELEPKDTKPLSIWEHAKQNYLNKGATFDEMVAGTAADLGISSKEVIDKIAGPKGKPMTQELYNEMSRNREIVAHAKAFLRDLNTPGYLKFFEKVGRFPFAIKTLGHAVGMVTHAGLNATNPYAMENWVKNFGRQWGFFFKPEYHERLMRDLETDPDFGFWKRNGLEINTNSMHDQIQQYSGWLGKAGSGGTRAMDALKTFRMDEAKREWAKTPMSERGPDYAKKVAEMINHATGAIGASERGFLAKGASFFGPVSFAARLEASRWARIIGDPAQTVGTLVNWKNATPAEKRIATLRTKRAISTVATYMGALALNQAILKASGSKDEVNFTDPTKADWLLFKVGGKGIDPTGGIWQPLRLILAAEMISSGKDFEHGEGKQERLHDLFGRYAMGKVNPLISLIFDVKTGQDFMGRALPWSSQKGTPKKPKYTWAEWVSQQGPIFVSGGSQAAYHDMRQSGANTMSGKNIAEGIATGATELTGVKAKESYKKK